MYTTGALKLESITIYHNQPRSRLNSINGPETKVIHWNQREAVVQERVKLSRN